MHLPGSTAINFLGCDFADDIFYDQTFLVLKYECASLPFNRYLSKGVFLWGKWFVGF
jgi:hypothetical protein